LETGVQTEERRKLPRGGRSDHENPSLTPEQAEIERDILKKAAAA